MNFPTFPERWYKLYTYVGVIMITYGMFSIYNEKVKWDSEEINYKADIIVLNNNFQILKEYTKAKIDMITAYSQIHEIQNPIDIKDSNNINFIVTPSIVLSQPDTFLINNVNMLYNKVYEMKEQQGQLMKENYLLSAKSTNLNFINIVMSCLTIVGLLFLVFGLRIWINRDDEY